MGKNKVVWVFLISLVLVASITGIGYLKWEQDYMEYLEYQEGKEKEYDDFLECCSGEKFKMVPLGENYGVLDVRYYWVGLEGSYVVFCGDKCVYISPISYEVWKESRPSFWGASRN